MASNPLSNYNPATDDDDRDLVAAWLTWDGTRIMAGALAGLFAGILMMAFAMIFAKIMGYEVLFPVKYAAVPILGGDALRFDNTAAVLVGFIAHEILSAVLGMFYAHFTATNALPALLGYGLVWGIFSWIFISNLFTPAFFDLAAIALPKSVFLPVNLVFGLGLPAVAFFDRSLRGKTA